MPLTTGPLAAPHRWAQVAVAALAGWAAIDVLKLTVAVGEYEDRIAHVTHGDADVLPAWLVYAVLDHYLPYGMATTLATTLWALGLFVAGIAFVTWLVRARHNAGRLGGAPALTPHWAVSAWLIPAANLVIPYLVVRDVRRASGRHPPARAIAATTLVGRWWAAVIVTVFLNVLAAWYSVLISNGGRFEGGALDTRLVAYPLWAAETVGLLVTAILSARVVRRITEAQQLAADTSG